MSLFGRVRLPHYLVGAGRIAIAMFAVLAALGEAEAKPRKVSTPTISRELAELFDLYCLQSFPDIDAMSKLADQRIPSRSSVR